MINICIHRDAHNMGLSSRNSQCKRGEQICKRTHPLRGGNIGAERWPRGLRWPPANTQPERYGEPHVKSSQILSPNELVPNFYKKACWGFLFVFSFFSDLGF